jgi:hypothetical protein
MGLQRGVAWHGCHKRKATPAAFGANIGVAAAAEVLSLLATYPEFVFLPTKEPVSRPCWLMANAGQADPASLPSQLC